MMARKGFYQTKKMLYYKPMSYGLMIMYTIELIHCNVNNLSIDPMPF